MAGSEQSVKGIIAYITTEKERFLGGAPLSLFANDTEQMREIAEAIARVYLADILQLPTGDCLVIKK